MWGQSSPWGGGGWGGAGPHRCVRGRHHAHPDLFEDRLSVPELIKVALTDLPQNINCASPCVKWSSLSSSWWSPSLSAPLPAVVQRAWQGVHLLRELEQGQLRPSAAPPRRRKLQRVIKSVRATIVCPTWIAASRCLSRTRKLIHDYLQPTATTCCSQDGDKGDADRRRVSVGHNTQHPHL